jgi:hypothetical protein
MLYDPKWEKKTEIKPYTIESLIAWLETQDPERAYDYWCGDGSCLLDTYVSSITGEPSSPDPKTHHGTCGGQHQYLEIAQSRPWTFGAALDRARCVAARR